ncbi:hypothetical protein [Paenibacillus sp. 481]|uniref:hypothetical protein n=1 Tax=Paenibacillus sp. 481 TaxID=2835869 RepID=UPI001E392917|nr:hypothetical protein [Paenibacillus sp. 481]UHA74899.1 hypothetical protein KIK04_07620 [Paenibacillus sp. 481]
MKIASRPQTSIRMVSKQFRLLYPLEDSLNNYIEFYAKKRVDINTLQIFFDTDITDENFVNLLDLKGGLLQAETSLNWDVFSGFEFKEQQIQFVEKIHNVVNQVVKVYDINPEGYQKAFQQLMNEIK